MPLTRRATLSLAGGAVIVAGVAGYAGWRRFAPKPQIIAANAPTAQPTTAGSPQAEDAHRSVRSIGDPQAKNTVTEFFSLTCTHCAAFARETMPSVEKDLIQPGKLRFVYHDFPLDQVALTAAMVARYLPPAQYYPFVSALFASQDRWAFARGIDSNEEIWKVAALAGMSRDTFNAAIGDLGLKNWILAQQQRDQNVWKIDSTPSFVIDGKKYAGEMDYDAFRKLLPEA